MISLKNKLKRKLLYTIYFRITQKMSINILSFPKSFSPICNLLKLKKVFPSPSAKKQKPLLKLNSRWGTQVAQFFRLRSWSHGWGIKPHVGLCTEHGAYLEFSLSLTLCPSPTLHTIPRAYIKFILSMTLTLALEFTL